ncbi:MAG: AAA family ATPase [Myxococcales bacterium]
MGGPVSAGMFTRVRQIQTGARFAVFRALRDGHPVVIKTLRPDRLDPRSEERLRQEGALLASMAVPGVVSVIASGELEGRPALVLPDVGPNDLEDCLRGARLDLPTFLDVAVQMAAIVAAVHRHGIIHRDLSPANFVRDVDGRITLVDFELGARSERGPAEASEELGALAAASNHPGQLEASLAYMAPEQTGRMNRPVDQRTDLYALGATFYALLVGAPPFSSNDPLELVHAHLAQTPQTPASVRPQIPQLLSDLVMKLLAKMPEWRYQTAEALQHDLEEARRRFQASGTIATFDLAQRERRDLQLPAKLYGREHERATLEAALTRAVTGQNELVVIRGLAGSGKTALVEALRTEVARQGHFLGGKCDQLAGNVPFAAVSQALGSLVRELSEASHEVASDWRARIESAISPNGRLVTEIVPELEKLLGAQPALPVLGPVETANRAELTMTAFVRALARPERPLVLFLDDLQWVDPASLKLIRCLGTQADFKHLLVVLAARSEDLGPDHPALQTFAEMRAAGSRLTDIEVPPLDADAITALLADTLLSAREDRQRCRPLAELLVRKTAGNPLFVHRFLRLLQLSDRLTFDAATAAWVWDLGRVAEVEAPETVVDLLVTSIRRLPTPVQEVLTTAACVGSRFDAALLAAAMERSQAELDPWLWLAVREVLIEPTGETSYRFAHDRVQQAAYAMIGETRRKALHFEIGQALLARTPAGALFEHIFAIVDQLNRGAEQLSTVPERRRLLDLNERAAGRAKATAAYGAALVYLRHAIELLPVDVWRSCHELGFRLHRDAAEMAFVTGDVQAAEKLLEIAQPHAHLLLEQADLAQLRVFGYQNQLDIPRAVRAGHEALSLFGLQLPREAIAETLAALRSEIELLLAGRAPDELLDAPLSSDPEHVALQALILSLTPVFFATDPPSFVVLGYWMMRSVLAQGHTLVAAPIYANFGSILCNQGEYARGHAFGVLGVNFAQRHGAREAATLFVAGVIHGWGAPLQSCAPMLSLATAKGIETGELDWASMSQGVLVQVLFSAGTDLSRVEKVADEGLAFSRRTGNRAGMTQILLYRQIIRCLRGLTGPDDRLDDADFDEEVFVKQIQTNGFALGYYTSVRLRTCRMLGDLAGALRLVEAGKGRLRFIQTTIEHAEYTFHAALTLIAAAEHSAEARDGLSSQIAPLVSKLDTWAETCPENFRHKRDLVGAELARLAGQDAWDLYHRAIEGAGRQGFQQDEATAQELCGRYALGRGQPRIAAQYLEGALASYARWGANAKVDRLRAELARVELTVVRRGATPTSSSGGAVGIDLMAALKAAETLSSEVTLDRLLDKLMRICVENAGAQRGVLLVEQQGRLQLAARFAAEGKQVDLSRPAPADVDRQISEAIVNHTLHTGEDVVLGNAAERGAFTRDPYVLAHSSKSILSVAVRHRDRITAILFLENQLTTDAFTHERLEMLRILLSQAAISLENARLYDSLRTSEELLRDCFEGMPVGVYVVDAMGRPVVVNRRAVEIAGRTLEAGVPPEEWAARHGIYLAGSDELYPISRSPIVLAMQGETSMADDLEVRSPNRRVPLAAWGTPIRGDDGAVRYAIVAFQDISTQRAMEAQRGRLEAQLHRAQRLESIGRLAAGVAHDFKNLLTPILGYSEIVAKALPPNSLVKQQIGQVYEAAEQAALLTNQLLTFGRQQPVEARELDLNQELQKFERMFSRLVRDDVEVLLQLDPALEKIRADPAQLQRVVMNLGMNALDAMPQGGRLTLETAAAPPSVQGEAAGVALRVRDTGSGMDEETLAKIFEPFFTTKAPGKGTGLGLPAVYGMVTQHGGTITAESHPGQGTTFEIILPSARTR